MNGLVAARLAGVGDLLVPLPPAPSFLVPGEPYTENRLFTAIKRSGARPFRVGSQG